MSQELGQSEEGERKTLPIERGFPIEQLNDLAEKEGYGGARQWYRPVYTMHKWWARRLGSVFRSLCLYTLADDPNKIEIHDTGENHQLSDYQGDDYNVEQILHAITLSDSDSLWSLYPKDVRIKDKKILDPFMGGGTSIVEASRFGVEAHGRDLNPVAWFVTKKELETGKTDAAELESAFEQIESDLKDKLKGYYKTPCPNHPDDHDADVMNSFWVKQLDCISCDNTVSLFEDYRVGKGRYDNSDKYHVYCPNCESVVLVDDWRSESICENCNYEFVPEDGTMSGSDYLCDSCGQKYSVTDAIEEQSGFDIEYYALEYYCEICDEKHGYDKEKVKNYKSTQPYDIDLFNEAKSEWESRKNLHEYVPQQDIPVGAKTAASSIDGSDVFRHGYQKWQDMFNERQLLSLSLLMERIDKIDNQNTKEYLLLTLTDSLRRNTMMIGYNYAGNQVSNLFRNKALDPPTRPAEGNIWGAKYGTCTFQSTWNKVIRGVKWGNSPSERYIEYPRSDSYPSIPFNENIDEPQTVETEPFDLPVGENATVSQGDVRDLDMENEYDAVITDPPYYDNIIYSELSDFFYVWQKILLEDVYDCFEYEKTPRTDSIVANPSLGKGAEEFETELAEAFEAIRKSLKDDGVLAFTYHHSDSESWGELLESLCQAGFEVTATYPITADISKFVEGEAVSFDIIIVGRPAGKREPISWNSLRRNIYRTAQRTRKQLEEERDLSRGDIGVVEMGRCFHEYSKHHGKVERAGETMTAKEVVDEIYGVIQHGSDIGEIDVFLDLLETPDASYDDLNKLSRGTNATPERMEDMQLYRMDDGFKLGTWDDEKRIAYIQSRVESDEELTDLDKAQFLRWRWEQGKSVSEYLGKWEITDDLRELCEGLADATGDDTYRNILESRLSDF
ncbi:MAG: DUF1156 domain-containing protein [archaeon]